MFLDLSSAGIRIIDHAGTSKRLPLIHDCRASRCVFEGEEKKGFIAVVRSPGMLIVSF